MSQFCRNNIQANYLSSSNIELYLLGFFIAWEESTRANGWRLKGSYIECWVLNSKLIKEVHGSLQFFFPSPTPGNCIALCLFPDPIQSLNLKVKMFQRLKAVLLLCQQLKPKFNLVPNSSWNTRSLNTIKVIILQIFNTFLFFQVNTRNSMVGGSVNQTKAFGELSFFKFFIV